jgi:uncharacterized protein DUF5818
MMQVTNLLRRLEIPALVLGLVSLGTPVLSQQQKPENPQVPDPNAQTQQQQQPSSPSAPQSQTASPSAGQTASPSPAASDNQMTPQSQTFTGKIVKADGNFVLQDQTSNATYQLDNQDQAKSYEGKSVKVTGTLDNSSKTIHVSAIEPFSS